MLQKLELNFNKIFWTLSGGLFILVAMRSYLVPFAHDEVANFLFYVQVGKFLPFLSHVDAMNHFLNNALTWPCYKVFGSSVLALRLPGLFAFAVLCFGTFKLSQLVNGLFAKLILFFGFVGCYHFIAFYSLCRGYGLSMAFLVLSLYYFFSASKQYSFKHFAYYVLFSQLALSANLTLVFVLLICSVVLIVFQYLNKQLFNIKTILLWLLYYALILFWIKYAFYLQNNGALYYGSGDSYWVVTFVSLIETIFLKSLYLNVIMVLTAVILLFYWVKSFSQQRLRFLLNSQFALTFLVFMSLVAVFYLLKLLLKVNYPEDRTGLFFYVFFILAIAFKVSETGHVYQKFSLVFPVFIIGHFVMHANLSTHPWRIYETIPTRFIQTLQNEQKKSSQKITIAGHRLREFIYGFINYNNQEKLNHITSPEALQMNGDYAIAYKLDKPYYAPFYNEIDEEKNWDFVLLKRKEAIARELLFESHQYNPIAGEVEYFNTYEKLDTTFNSNNPLLAEFELDFNEVSVPLNAWLVLQIDDANNGEMSSLVRVPLNLIQKNFNGSKSQVIDVMSGNIPTNIKRIVCYLWNIDKNNVQIQIKSFKLFRLNAKGIQNISQAKI